MPTIRRLRADEWRAYREVRLRALADAPDAFGSTLQLEASRPDEAWRARVEEGVASDLDLPLVVADGHRLVGLAWGKIDPARPEIARVFQMWVAPHLRDRRLGARMLAWIVEWARAAGARRLALGVARENGPARRLYRRAGFEDAGAPEPLRPGSAVMCQAMVLELRGR